MSSIGVMAMPADFRYRDVFLKGKPEHDRFDLFRIRHPSMDVGRRAKIFSPFDAMKGFNEAIASKEVRYHDRIELSDEDKTELDHKLRILKGLTFNGYIARENRVKVTVIYYIPCADEHNESFGIRGRYQKITGICWNVDELYGSILVDKVRIPFDDILRISNTDEYSNGNGHQTIGSDDRCVPAFYVEPDTEEIREIIAEVQRSQLSGKFIKAGSAILTSGEMRPTNVVPVIASSRNGRKAAFPMKWGFQIPGRSLLVNARVETAVEKPTFKEAWESHRCIIPASWYYEWEHLIGNNGQKKVGDKYMIQPSGSSMTWLAGLYRLEDGLPVFTVLTKRANRRTAPYP